ncbi:MAG TPA: prephenate dehydrogenase/arogenate dehydrogenase family protein [Lactobacillaceae bacterium]|jgi:prephenate dehydrogenase
MTQVAVVGLGAIGASIAGALSAAGQVVLGVEPDEENAQINLQAGYVARVVTFETAIELADVLILSGPISVILAQLTQLKQVQKPLVVVDTASVKGVILAQSAQLPAHVQFVGGHPMAGTHASGAGAADRELFVDRSFFLVGGSAFAQRQIQLVLAPLQAHFQMLTAPEHDRLVAGISHLPHVVASTLVNSVAAGLQDGQPEWLELAAGGFLDTTRIAAADPVLWQEILLANVVENRAFIQAMQTQLAALDADLAQENTAEVLAILTQAQQIRKAKMP